VDSKVDTEARGAEIVALAYWWPTVQAIDDVDSAFGDSDDESAYSTSVASTIHRHVYENGWRYHSFREGTYVIPDDEDEQGEDRSIYGA